MAVLALDTATDTLAVAIGNAGEVIASACVRVPRGHSRLLQPTAAKLLTAAGLTPGELTGVCVGIGPGSYTGVRMAVSTAKAMASALGVPLYTASTLAAVSEAVCATTEAASVTVVPLLYARRQRAFGAVYSRAAAHQSVFAQADGPVVAQAGGPVQTWVVDTAPQVRSLSEWAAVVADGSKATTRRVVVHDFFSMRPQVQDELAPVLETLVAHADAVLSLRDVSSGLAPALLRLVAMGAVDMYVKDEIHAVAPNYALAVEAEVKLAERSDPHGNR